MFVGNFVFGACLVFFFPAHVYIQIACSTKFRGAGEIKRILHANFNPSYLLSYESFIARQIVYKKRIETSHILNKVICEFTRKGLMEVILFAWLWLK